MPRIKVSEILALKKRQSEINSYNLEDIIFIDDEDKPFEIDHEIIDDFRFTGLNNIDFITSNFYKHGWDSGEKFSR